MSGRARRASETIASASRRAWRRCSCSEGLGEVFGALLEPGATGHLGEQPLEGVDPMSGEQLGRAPVEPQPPLVDDDHPVADALDDIEDVRAVDDGLAFTRQRLNERLEADRGVRVEAVERLVEE